MCDLKIVEVVKRVLKEESRSPFPSLQYRVVAHVTNAHTPYCKLAQPKMADAIFGFGLSHAPSRAQGLDRKNTIVGKARGKAATMHNKQFGAMAGVAR